MRGVRPTKGERAMPNGRSGGFLMGKTELEGLLRAQREDSTIGRPVAQRPTASLTSTSTSISAGAAIRMLKEFKPDDVWVEEQDRQYYIIHFDLHVEDAAEPNPYKWVIVGSESPLFDGLRRHHHA
jgi:hypothetical protein